MICIYASTHIYVYISLWDEARARARAAGQADPSEGRRRFRAYWALVKGLKLSYHNKETICCTMDPYYGNLN